MKHKFRLLFFGLLIVQGRQYASDMSAAAASAAAAVSSATPNRLLIMVDGNFFISPDRDKAAEVINYGLFERGRLWSHVQ